MNHNIYESDAEKKDLLKKAVRLGATVLLAATVVVGGVSAKKAHDEFQDMQISVDLDAIVGGSQNQ